jgi:nucleoid-associated protein YgaU
MLDDKKLKYQSVLNLISQKGVRLANMHMEGDKFFLKGAAPNEAIKNEIWNQIKAVEPNWQADLICDLSIDPSLPQPQKTYTVVKGDSLWKIAEKFLGNGAQYPRIIAANPNRLKDENSVIHPGDVLVIPD